MKPELFYIGITHKSAPLSVRDRLPASRADHRAMLAQLGDLAPERMILHTCERFEVYALTTRREVSAWIAIMAERFGVSTALLAQHVHLRQGEAVAAHLLRVAAGLESRIVGEPHILGQVRDALLDAAQFRAAGAILNALARSAIHAGKRVRSETPINTVARSIATMAVNHLERALGALPSRTVLIVGSGKLARDVAGTLAWRGTGKIIFVSRSLDRASALARKFRGVGLGLGCLPRGLAQSDAVITCTCSPPVVIDASTISKASGSKLRILDLGVPRNVCASVERLPHVELSHLDGLLSKESACHESREADHIVAEELGRFVRWHREREVAPLIAEKVRQWRALDGSDARIRNCVLHAQIMRIKAGVAS